MKRLIALSAASIVAVCGLAVANAQQQGGQPPAAPPARVPARTVLETAGTTATFATFTAAMKAAGLSEALSGEGPFTVFAPTDAAFAKLPPGTLENLLKPENKAQLANILKYHVIAGSEFSAAQVSQMRESSKTLQGSTFQIVVKDGRITIGNDPSKMATVTKADIDCTNGVIHAIDAVMMPPAK